MLYMTSEGSVSDIDPIIEKRLIRRYDTILLPTVCIMYMCNSLDRFNLGNAKTDCLEANLGLHGQQYSLLVSLFYITFCGFCLPWNMVTERYHPRFTLPMMMFSWGLMAMCCVFAKNFTGILVMRLLLGFFEAGFSAGTIYYLSTIYKRAKLAKRIAWFYFASTVGGSFSSLISFGVFHISKPRNSIYGWQALFLVEGLLTMLIAIPAFLVIPQSMSTCRWLRPEERAIAVQRMLADGSSKTEVQYKFKEALEPFKDWKSYVWAMIALCYGIASASTSNFLPQIVARLGYSTVNTNLLTIAPNFVGACVLVMTASSSDRKRERTLHLLSAFSLSLIGYIMLFTIPATKHNRGVIYFAAFILTSGAYTPSVIFHTWHMNNKTSETHRAVDAGFLTMFANSAGLISANTFLAREAPKYATNLKATFGGAVGAIVITSCVRLWMMKDNKIRDQVEGVSRSSGDVDTGSVVNGSQDIRWRWFL